MRTHTFVKQKMNRQCDESLKYKYLREESAEL